MVYNTKVLWLLVLVSLLVNVTISFRSEDTNEDDNNKKVDHQEASIESTIKQQQQQQPPPPPLPNSSNTKSNNITIPTKFIGYDVRRKPVLIPLVGAGTWLYNDTIAYESLCKAFALGITLVDTAFGYRNEYGVGQAIQDCFYNNNNYTGIVSSSSDTSINPVTSIITKDNNVVQEQRQLHEQHHGIRQQQLQQQQQTQYVVVPKQVNDERTRDELFVLTKVPGGLSGDETIAAHYHNLKLLNMDYVDHVMVHYPSDWDITPSRANKLVRQDQWRALEDLYYTYKTRSIGISHYCSRHIQDILEIATVPISINQVEYHVGSGDINTVIDTCRTNNITFMSYSPLCGPCQYEPQDSLIDGVVVSKIATRYNVTGAQVSLRYIIQQALDDRTGPYGPVIPKSNNIDHIRANMDIFSFRLSDEDMIVLNEATKPPAEAGDCDVP